MGPLVIKGGPIQPDQSGILRHSNKPRETVRSSPSFIIGISGLRKKNVVNGGKYWPAVSFLSTLTSRASQNSMSLFSSAKFPCYSSQNPSEN